ncbi:MBL fold metallo-hydrolase [Bernardetia sp. OM2101]|uniref:MBL fold metallo-hydrolase n=1 Tax=Bernardetia sp. OM2101 TaxID=3344876 RepID=UPI0035CFAF02
MTLHTIDTGLFKLDGGAMFGVVPKVMWQKLNPADQNNMCTWAMRCLLIEDSNKLILIDTGIGNKQDEKFTGHFHLHGEDSLENSLKQKGFSTSDITDVFLTHLHFDHCGGAIKRKKDKLIPVFDEATYWSNTEHWNWAIEPNPREKASFLKENILPIKESGQLKLLSSNQKNDSLPFDLRFVDGHTEKQMLPQLKYKDRTIVFCADLIPSVHHVRLPYIMAYDMRPLKTLTEKEELLNEAVENDYILFFEHDPINQCCTLQKTDRGIMPKEIGKLSDFV